MAAGSKLDAAVRRISVFASWEDLSSSIRRGYTPTIRVDAAACPTPADVRAAEIVRRACVYFGHAYFDGARMVRQ